MHDGGGGKSSMCPDYRGGVKKKTSVGGGSDGGFANHWFGIGGRADIAVPGHSDSVDPTTVEVVREAQCGPNGGGGA
jgi:hypothetical protein